MTSAPVQSVSLYSKTEANEYGPEPMKTTDSLSWTFKAEFYEAGTHTLWVDAIDANGNHATDSITVRVYEANMSDEIANAISMLGGQ